jgi:hypothetical protein
MAYDPFFDAKFYTSHYPDLAHLRPDQAAVHYRLFGKREGRAGCSREFVHEQRQSNAIGSTSVAMQSGPSMLSRSIGPARPVRPVRPVAPARSFGKVEQTTEEEKKTVTEETDQSNLFNILIRTCMRPNYFRKCMQSVLTQTYQNFRVWISYDKQESYHYIKPFVEKHPNKVSAHYINMDNVSTEKYRFNLYCNVLMDMVSEGYIIFLDDDDLFARNDALAQINSLLVGDNPENTMVLWKISLPHGIVYPADAPAIVFGGIDTSCVCFHSSHKHKSRWPDKRGGDFTFFSGLMQSESFTYCFLPLILTKSVYTGHRAGGGLQGELE